MLGHEKSVGIVTVMSWPSSSGVTQSPVQPIGSARGPGNLIGFVLITSGEAHKYDERGKEGRTFHAGACQDVLVPQAFAFCTLAKWVREYPVGTGSV